MARHLGSAATGVHLPVGTYAKLLKAECEGLCEPDMRLYPIETWPDGMEEWEERKRQAAVKAAAMLAEKLTAGEPVVVASSKVDGRQIPGAPEWLTTLPLHGGASAVRVYRDDVVEPAEFYGDMSGRVWEHIPVEPQHQPR